MTIPGLKPLTVIIALAGGFALAVPQCPANEVQSLTLQAQQAYGAKDYELAEERYRKALSLPGITQPKVQIVLLSNLGAACREARKFPEAEDAFRRAIALAKKSGMAHDPVSLVAMRQYAVLLRRMKKTQEADAMEVEALEPSVRRNIIAPRISIVDFHATVPKRNAPATADDFPADDGERIVSVEKVTIEQLKQQLQHNPDDYDAWAVLAHKYNKARNWVEMANACRNIVRKFPAKELVGRSGLAWCCYQQGQYPEAVEECKRVLVLDPENPDFYRILSGSYSNLGSLQSKLEIDEAFVEKFPGHPDHSAVSAALPFLRRDIKALSTDTPTVVPPTTSEQTKCWARHRMPIKVYIHDSADDSIKFTSTESLITDNTPGEIIQRAMEAWVQATEGRISFERTERQEEANICCFFTKDPDGLNNDCAAGITSWNMEASRPQAKISLLAVNRHDGKPVDRTEFYDTCLHEFGHALGLEHSKSTADIMYRSVHTTPLAALSENDKQRIVTLYKLGH